MTLTRANGQARLDVSDTGPGISAADLPHVFDRFWRAAQAGQTAGSGIGLAVAAGLARAHHATIEVSSQPGSGTLFTLVVPMSSQTIG
jgi:two-component system sensor histidine kinase BaeS